MRPFTVRTDLVANDRASKTFNKINDAANRMSKNLIRESSMAGSSFVRFAQKVSYGAKQAAVSLNNVNASVNRTIRGIGKKLGTLGQLGLGIGFLAIATTIIGANVELDKSFASLSAITGKSGAEFDVFKKQVSDVSKSQTLFAGDVAKAFEIVASAKPELLSNAEALGKVTNAAITLSKASGDDLAQSSLSLAGVMNQFTLGASEAERVMNSLAAGSVAGSANITNVAASMKSFGAVASDANISMEQSVALIEVMGSKSIFAEDAGNSLKAAILNLKNAGVGYSSGLFNMSDALTEVKAKIDAAKTAKEKDQIATDIFKKTGISTGLILLNNVGMYEDMTKAVTGTTTAVDQMNIKANTFSNRWNEITDSFKNSVSATSDQETQMQSLKDAMDFVAQNMDKIIASIIVALKIFAIYKVVMAGASIVTWLYSAAVKNAVRATWSFTAALLSNPITWIVVGIAALIAAIAALIIYWKEIVTWVKESDNWFAKLIRAAIYPLIVAFGYLSSFMDKVALGFSRIVNWIRTSNSSFAQTLRIIGSVIGVLFDLIGLVDRASESFSNIVNWLSTSNSAFAQTFRIVSDGIGKVFDGIVWLIKKGLEPLILGFQAIGKIFDMFSSKTQKELGVNINKTTKEESVMKFLTPAQRAIMEKKKSNDTFMKMMTPAQRALMEQKNSVDVTSNANTDLIKSLEKNSTELDKNTKSGENKWKGKFATTILKDYNIADGMLSTNNVSKELATNAISTEISNSKIQNDIINNTNAPDEVVTKSNTNYKRKNDNNNGNITINVVDRTGGKFGLDLQSNGVNLVTTGNKG